MLISWSIFIYLFIWTTHSLSLTLTVWSICLIHNNQQFRIKWLLLKQDLFPLSVHPFSWMMPFIAAKCWRKSRATVEIHQTPSSLYLLQDLISEFDQIVKVRRVSYFSNLISFSKQFLQSSLAPLISVQFYSILFSQSQMYCFLSWARDHIIPAR